MNIIQRTSRGIIKHYQHDHTVPIYEHHREPHHLMILMLFYSDSADTVFCMSQSIQRGTTHRINVGYFRILGCQRRPHRIDRMHKSHSMIEKVEIKSEIKKDSPLPFYNWILACQRRPHSPYRSNEEASTENRL